MSKAQPASDLTVLRVAAVLRELRAVQRPAVLPLERRGPGRVRAGGGAAALRDGVVGVLQHERHTLAVDEPKDLRGRTRQDSDSISVVKSPFVDNSWSGLLETHALRVDDEVVIVVMQPWARREQLLNRLF